MTEAIKQVILLYTEYIEGLKRLSEKERDEITDVLFEHSQNKNHE